MKDPIVEEVRKYRMEHTRKFGGNLEAICADLDARQRAAGRVAVRLTPLRKATRSTAHRAKIKQAA